MRGRKRAAPAPPPAPDAKAAAVADAATGDTTRPTRPRARRAVAAAPCIPRPPPPAPAPAVGLTLYVRWHSPSGRSRVNALPLKAVPCLDALQGVSRSLVERAFPRGTRRPDHLTSPAFLRYTPAAEFLTLPSDVARTEFRLAATCEATGWEYGLLRRDLGGDGGDGGDADCNMLVTVVEFESTALMAGSLGVRLALVAYPVVSIRKAFLDATIDRIVDDPDAFEGLM